MNTVTTPTQQLTQAIEQLSSCARDLAGAHRDVAAALPNLADARNTRAWQLRRRIENALVLAQRLAFVRKRARQQTHRPASSCIKCGGAKGIRTSALSCKNRA